MMAHVILVNAFPDIYLSTPSKIEFSFRAFWNNAGLWKILSHWIQVKTNFSVAYLGIKTQVTKNIGR